MAANNLLLKYLKKIPKEPEQSATTTSEVKVKQERKDASSPKPAPPPQPAHNRPPPAAPKPPPVEKPPDDTPPPIDLPSIKGHFGWLAIGKDHLPFIVRGESKYFAVRMVESEIISKYTKILPYDAFTYTNIKSYYITENEAKLLNEINLFHCNSHYSTNPFTIKDVVVSVEDTQKFYDYLEFCKRKNEPGSFRVRNEMKERCGLVQINKQHLVPYLIKGSECYVLHSMLPESVYGEPSGEPVDDWDLAYMKFVCWIVDVHLQKVQTGDILCLVSSLKNYNGNSTTLQELPVNKNLRESLMNTAAQHSYHFQQSLKENYNRNMIHSGMMPNSVTGNFKVENQLKNACGCRGPCSHLVDMRGNAIVSNSVLNGQLRAVPASGYWNSGGYHQMIPTDHSQKVSDNYKNLRLSLGVPASGFLKQSDLIGQPKTTSHQAVMSTSRSELDVLFPPPPPLVRVDGSYAGTVPVSAPSPAESNNLRPPPPPLQPAAQYGSKSSSNPVIVDVLSLVSKDAASRSEEIRQTASKSPEDNGRSMAVIPPHHYPTPPQSSPLQASVTPTPVGISLTLSGDGPTVLPGGAVIDLCSPPPSPDNRVRVSGDNTYHQMPVPHIVQNIQVDGKLLPCINLEPFKHKSMPVTSLSALVSTFFPNVSVQSCQFALKNVLNVTLYPYRGIQVHHVSLANLGFSLIENDPLVSVSDAQLYLPHLVYMFQQTVSNDQSSSDRNLDGPASKRLCTSSSAEK